MELVTDRTRLQLRIARQNALRFLTGISAPKSEAQKRTPKSMSRVAGPVIQFCADSEVFLEIVLVVVATQRYVGIFVNSAFSKIDAYRQHVRDGRSLPPTKTEGENKEE